jgi:ribosomal protein S6--L-glutamate ligase
MEDYTPDERSLIRNADRIFFPTPRFVDTLEAISKVTFPSAQSYRYQRSRLLQTLLFQELGWPHPHTRIYFGSRQKQRILLDFRLPFWAMGAYTKPFSLHRIECRDDLEAIAATMNPIVVRDMIPWEDRVRLISVQYECLAAQRVLGGWWEVGGPLEPVALSEPKLASLLPLHSKMAEWLHLDDILVEWGYRGGQWYFIEMGRPPLRIRTIDHIINRHWFVRELIDRGAL